MGAGALTICHNKAAVQVKEDMKKMARLPILRPRATAASAVESKGSRLFGVSLLELRELGLVEDGVPLVLRSMVEHLRHHALQQEGLFRVNGNVRAVESLRQRLESSEDTDVLSEADACTVASLLKQYLRELPGGLVDATVQHALIKLHQEHGDDGSWADMRELLQQLPDVHYSLLHFLCHFLTQVESQHKDNRMTTHNLATVFGPNVFHVPPGFEAMRDQNICNKIMAKFIQNYSSIFENHTDKELPTLIIVKEANVTETDTKNSSGGTPSMTPTPVPRKKKVKSSIPPDVNDLLSDTSVKTPTATPRKKKVRKGNTENALQPIVPHPSPSIGLPHVRPLPVPLSLTLTLDMTSPSPMEMMETTASLPGHHRGTPDNGTPWTPSDITPSGSLEALNRSPDERERPISPFYMSNHLSPVFCRPDVTHVLGRTIRSTVEQHLFEVNIPGGQGSGGRATSPRVSSPGATPTPTARQRRRQQREQQEEGSRLRDRSRAVSLRARINKENIPASGRASLSAIGGEEARTAAPQGAQSAPNPDRRPRRRSKQSPRLALLANNHRDQTVSVCGARADETPGEDVMESSENGNDSPRMNGLPTTKALRMKIQEPPFTCDAGRFGGSGGVHGSDSECEDHVPRLDLTALTEDGNGGWGDPPCFSAHFLDLKLSFCHEPVPAYSAWQRDSMDQEARPSPHAGGRLIQQLLDEDSDPMLSPRFYAYGHCQQYLDDTEVPPSPPNSHSFMSRRRSSSLGSCDDEKEELTTAQLSKRIHILKKKIHKFEERFEEERKYRPSHVDKANNPEALRWSNELAKLRKELKEHKLMKSEEDLPPLTRQRSNTLPKSFGSQLEKKPQQEKTVKPPAESTLEVVLSKLQEKREEVGRPEDIKDMTREQIGAEKVSLQKALLYYESIHGRPITKNERQIMKPLYDRYRLVKQILVRASSIPVIGSPSSKRRGPLLQPIIEGEPSLFFDDIKEEEDGSDDDAESKTQFSVSVRPDPSMLGFLEQLEEDADGFISPVDELSPSKNTTDMRLSNLHSATTQELVEQLQETREEKKRLRKNLREFEDQFLRQNGRNAQKEDRSPLAVEYSEYKHVKAKLRLLEVLISKKDSTKFI